MLFRSCKGIYNVHALTDSNLLASVLNGKTRSRSFAVYDTVQAIRRLVVVCVSKGGKVVFDHVTRNRNTVADAEANAAMDRQAPVASFWRCTCDIDRFPSVEKIHAWAPSMS